MRNPVRIPQHFGRSRRPAGIALVLTVLLVGLMMVMGMTMINLAGSDHQIATNESRSVQALFNADAGLEETAMRLSPNAPAASAIPIGTTTDWRAYILSGHSQAEIQGGLDPTYGVNPGGGGGTSNYFYFSTVQTGGDTIPWGWARAQLKTNGANPVYLHALTGAETTTASQVVGSNTVWNPPVLVITSEGIQNNVRRMISAEYRPLVATTTTTTEVITDPFADAVHGRGQVDLGGNGRTDSYNSDNGDYNVNGNRFGRGDVSTDRVGSSSVVVGPNAIVDGSVYVGPAAAGGNATTDINAVGTITGSTGTEPHTWHLPLSTIPSGVANQGPLSIAGNRTVTLSEGTYWFSSISVAGNGRLATSGRVKIYVTGSVDIGGNGTATAGNKPPNLVIYGTVDPTNSANKCTSVSIHGNGSFYGAVYAPDAAITVVGNGDTYGALTGNTVNITGNGNFHYDEALGDFGRTITTTVTTNYTTTGYDRWIWREIPF